VSPRSLAQHGGQRRYAVSSWLWAPVFTPKALDKAYEFGFDGIEIPTFDGKLDVVQIRDVLGSHSKIVPIIIGGGSASTDLSSEDASVVSSGVEYIKRCLEVCSKLGGDLICGPLYSTVGAPIYLTETHRQRVLEHIAVTFKDIGKFGNDLGVRLALEPLCRYDTHLINTSKQGMQLVEKIGEENVGLLLDTFHLNIEEKSFSNAITLAGDKLFHLHACENDRGAPGSGLVQWEQVAEAVDSIKYKGWIAIESFVPFENGFSSAMRVWRRLEENQDDIASKGLAFLKSKFG